MDMEPSEIRPIVRNASQKKADCARRKMSRAAKTPEARKSAREANCARMRFFREAMTTDARNAYQVADSARKRLARAGISPETRSAINKAEFARKKIKLSNTTYFHEAGNRGVFNLQPEIVTPEVIRDRMSRFNTNKKEFRACDMENLLISFQSMKSEMVELRNENRRIVGKLDRHNSKIISLSEELQSVKKEMCIYAKQERHMKSILETVGLNNLDNSNSNVDYISNTSNTLINNENDFENISDNNIVIQETLIKKEMQDGIEDNSTFYENDDYNYNLSNMTDTMINTENVLNDNNTITNEITVKTELENQNDENIEGNLEKESNFIDKEDNSLNFINESEYQGSIEISNPQTSNLSTVNDHLNARRFTQSSSLNSHLKIREIMGEKLFKCNICSKKFSYSSTLKNHLRLHTGVKSFECKQCSKRFQTDGILKTHLRLHTGEKLYECKQCSKRFAQYPGLYTHLKSHTGK